MSQVAICVSLPHSRLRGWLDRRLHRMRQFLHVASIRTRIRRGRMIRQFHHQLYSMKPCHRQSGWGDCDWYHPKTLYPPLSVAAMEREQHRQHPPSTTDTPS